MRWELGWLQVRAKWTTDVVAVLHTDRNPQRLQAHLPAKATIKLYMAEVKEQFRTHGHAEEDVAEGLVSKQMKTCRGHHHPGHLVHSLQLVHSLRLARYLTNGMMLEQVVRESLSLALAPEQGAEAIERRESGFVAVPSEWTLARSRVRLDISSILFRRFQNKM